MSCGRNVPPGRGRAVVLFLRPRTHWTDGSVWAQWAAFRTCRKQTGVPPVPPRGWNSCRAPMTHWPGIRCGYPQLAGSQDAVTEKCEQEGQPPAWLFLCRGCCLTCGRNRLPGWGPAREGVPEPDPAAPTQNKRPCTRDCVCDEGGPRKRGR